ncbi:D-aspartate ligase [Rhodovulum iodosum]|uniref:D-aspartate ligase n=1 Tax=Rhodovulum iodosum TaxID=68291 RepID=A0ABV3XY55_9RHOB|nr:carboxylate--amine ligase [Rhodovulum robiginosum]RSK38346.1 carboxylate--amine ligase [Rhodovulum robiginosum]
MKLSTANEISQELETSTPVLILGGAANSAALARNLARVGITVSAAGKSGCLALDSRHCHGKFRAPAECSIQDFWRELLLERPRPELEGSLIFALCDDSIEFVTSNHAALSQRYLLEGFDPALRREMLDKRATLVRARAAGVATPNFWDVDSAEKLEEIREDVSFPVMVKPIHSHLFIPVFGRKLFIIESDWEELVEKVQLAQAANCDVMVMEMVPGPDSLLSSYYTYIDEDGKSLFHYTKCIIRRYPVNRGGACYHQSKWLPETAEAGRKFFGSMPWRGMANIEFKRDLRDGKLKVIEVNPRFTDAHRMVVSGGLPIDEMIYRRQTGQDVPAFSGYEENVRMWNPLRDFLAFRELNKRGELSFPGWIKSLMSGRKVLPILSLTDPMPTVVRLREEFGRAFKRLGK